MIATHDLPSLTSVLSRVVEPIGPHPLEQLARTTSEPIRPAAVLVPIVLRDGGAELLLTVRNANLKSHPGQISFPGGRVDASDRDVGHTALREAEEELGIRPEHVQLLGSLTLFATGTGYGVVPVVGLIPPDYPYQPAAEEVAEVFHVPLSHVLDPRNHQACEREYQGERRRYFEIWFGDYRIWGATAGMIVGLHQRLSEMVTQT
jgi:8-oxo-dGTP pyrophosphatase MutT (NUDIX family)